MKCDVGEGDCDNNNHCTGALVCGRNNGLKFSMDPAVDVCVPALCTNGVKDVATGEIGVDCGGDCGTCPGECPDVTQNGNPQYCSAACPCEVGEGDCDGDDGCVAGTHCGTDNGADFGQYYLNDVCIECVSNGECDNGNVCDGVESCVGGACVAGTPFDCNDGDACNGEETCDPINGCGAGVPLVCDDGDACNGAESCDPATGCAAGTALTCDDGDACNGVESCDGATGCVPGVALVCDDGNECTAKSCDAATGCGYEALIAGTVCTMGICDGLGGCVACIADADCGNGDACDGVETCVNNMCVQGVALVCDDGDACNGVETCDLATGCVAGTSLVCDDGNVCNGVESCEVSTGCVAGTALTCDDGNECTNESCDAISGCGYENVTAGAACATGMCDGAGVCVECVSDADCSNGDACDGVESCVSNVCQAGTALACDDGDACNGVETCDSATGCVAGTSLVCD
ncbi:MAG: hypothetical protein JXX14_03925, partial [Deltaproteobacteria bacterium]|nr:hypothetical protein [Deltaproteobacteria bacterium]